MLFKNLSLATNCGRLITPCHPLIHIIKHTLLQRQHLYICGSSEGSTNALRPSPTILRWGYSTPFKQMSTFLNCRWNASPVILCPLRKSLGSIFLVTQKLEEITLLGEFHTKSPAPSRHTQGVHVFWLGYGKKSGPPNPEDVAKEGKKRSLEPQKHSSQ